jgi:hypothetical protein
MGSFLCKPAEGAGGVTRWEEAMTQIARLCFPVFVEDRKFS